MRRLIILSTFLFLGLSCKDEFIYPLNPILSNPQFLVFLSDSSVSVTISCSFTDGDGDVGFKQNESGSEANFFIIYKEKNNGVYDYLTLPILNAQNEVIGIDTIDYNSRIPYFNTDGTKKSVQGEIAINNIDLTNSTSDTVQFEFYLVDRAGNQSNTLIVSEIAIR